jgi:hypothetical protein
VEKGGSIGKRGVQTSSACEVNAISTKINSLWEHFSKMCQELIDKHVPSKMTSVRYSQAWINTEIKRLSRKKQKAYDKVKASKKTKDWDHYKSIKRKCQIECRKAYNNYVSTMLNNDIKSNPKSLWSFIKIKRCDSTGVAPLSKGGNNHSGSLEKANILNDQFTSVFAEEDTTNVPTMGPSPFPDLEQIQIHPIGIKSLLV